MVLGVSVVYEDKDFLIINKPAGILVHKTANQESEKTVADWLGERYPETAHVGDEPRLRPGMVHRLDKDTSGVMVVARNEEAFLYLKKLFRERLVKKTYLGLVLGKLPEQSGTIDFPIGLRSGTARRTVALKKAKLVKPAATRYRALKFFRFQEEDLTLAEIEPLTGRTHQIRVHLNAIHHPVLGDRFYGGRKPMEIARALGLKRQFLHASVIEFTAPSGAAIKASVGLPPDLEQALSQLGAGPADHRWRN